MDWSSFPEYDLALRLLQRLDAKTSYSQLMGMTFDDNDRTGARWCWHTGVAAGQHQPPGVMCRYLLLFLLGATRSSDILPETCVKWGWLGLPDVNFVRDSMYYRFRDGYLLTDYWPPLLRKPGGVFWEVGANDNANLASKHFRKWRPEHIHLFEPVPFYHENLMKTWPRKYRNATAHNFGLGRATQRTPLFVAGGSSSTYQQLHISASRMYLDSIGDGIWRQNRETLHVNIRSVAQVWRSLNMVELAVLSLNCEGCEYDVLPAMAQAKLLSHVEVILVQLHTVLTHAEARKACDPSTGTCGKDAAVLSINRYCNLSALLGRTHQRRFGLPFHAFELWRRVDS